VQRFESAAGLGANLDAVWTVIRIADGVVKSGRTAVHQSVRGGHSGAVAAAHSRAVAQLSEDIATAIRSLYDTAKS
jgi:uncharacterized protein